MIEHKGPIETRILMIGEEYEIIQVYYDSDHKVAFWGNDLTNCRFPNLESIKTITKNLISALAKPLLTESILQDMSNKLD